mmetsp:Transcript_12742/g.34964  ORF Transcript_12742/g.34964 Transcript_12742/m.34964 type:complete len:341 (-) Transcript_12742:66-1088(-)
MAMLQPPAAGGEDNFAFIDRLLDTLQAEGGPEPWVESKRHTPREPPSPSLNGQGELDVMGALELCEPVSQPRATRASAGAPAPCESMNNLLSRFCEDGDESIVDQLLDNFLGSAGDAGSLIEAIGKGMVVKPLAQPQWPVQKTDLSAPVKIDMEKLRLQELESPCLKTWDALLLSARDLLQSARSHSPSCNEAATLPACVQDNAAPGGSSQPSTAGRSAERRPEVGGGNMSSGNTEAGSSAANEHGDALSMDLNSADMRRDLLSKIAEMEDHEAMRTFMRHFLISMRRRLLSELPGGPEANDEAEFGPGDDRETIGSTSTQDFDDDRWSCRSVNTVTVED